MQILKSIPFPKKYRALVSLILSILTLVVAFWSSHKNEPVRTETHGDLLVATSSSRISNALVTEVIDGDTIRLETGETVRYIGIDTPETRHPNKPVECFGKEASQKNIDLVLGRNVKLVKDVSEVDRYGRLLRYVYVGETFINEELVKEGYAYSSAFPPDISQQELLNEAQKSAQERVLGLWNSSICPPTRDTAH